jgi:hypothetical protein
MARKWHAGIGKNPGVAQSARIRVVAPRDRLFTALLL